MPSPAPKATPTPVSIPQEPLASLAHVLQPLAKIMWVAGLEARYLDHVAQPVRRWYHKLFRMKGKPTVDRTMASMLALWAKFKQQKTNQQVLGSLANQHHRELNDLATINKKREQRRAKRVAKKKRRHQQKAS